MMIVGVDSSHVNGGEGERFDRITSYVGRMLRKMQFFELFNFTRTEVKLLETFLITHQEQFLAMDQAVSVILRRHLGYNDLHEAYSKQVHALWEAKLQVIKLALDHKWAFFRPEPNSAEFNAACAHPLPPDTVEEGLGWINRLARLEELSEMLLKVHESPFRAYLLDFATMEARCVARLITVDTPFMLEEEARFEEHFEEHARSMTARYVSSGFNATKEPMSMLLRDFRVFAQERAYLRSSTSTLFGGCTSYTGA